MSNNKNVWLVSTDRPSRLSLLKSGKLNFGAEIISSSNSIPQNIYITNDEEIEEGDWVITPNKNIMLVKVKYSTESSFMIGNMKHQNSPYYIEFCRKIILTTDQDLVKYGVQTIDDEFLEWFAKNPSCVRVEVEKEMYVPQINGKISDGKITHELSLDPSQNTLPYYKIIIPKEEPNEEAIKEALKRLRRTPMTFVPDKIMYSEEEAFDLLLRAKVETDTMYYEEMKEWFEQVKKK
jgi:hypothetical protein